MSSCSFERSQSDYRVTLQHIPEEGDHQSRRCESLKCRVYSCLRE